MSSSTRNFGVENQEPADFWREQQSSERGPTTDPDQTGWDAFAGPYHRFGFGEGIEDVETALVKLPPFVRQAQGTGRPADQAYPKMLFQRADLLAHRRLGGAQFLGDAAE